MATVTDVVYFMVAGFNLMAMTLVGVAFFQAGIFMPFLKVKASRGEKLLVRILHPVQSYFVTGRLNEGYLVFRDREKHDRRILYMPGCIDRAAGVYWIAVDDEKNCLVQRMDGVGVDGHDAVKYDELYKRALYKPSALNELLLKIALIGIIIIAIIAVIVAVMSFKGMQNSGQILELLGASAAKAATTGTVA